MTPTLLPLRVARPWFRRSRWRSAVLLLSGLVGMAGLALSQGTTVPSPSRDYVRGFECGVRYGLMARALAPAEDSIPVLTESAKYLQWVMVVQRNDPTAMDCPQKDKEVR